MIHLDITEKEFVGNECRLAFSGRLDVMSAYEMEKFIKTIPDDIDTFYINMKNLEYISSAGIRILILLAKIAKDNGVHIIDACQEVYDTLDMSGMTDFLDVKQYSNR